MTEEVQRGSVLQNQAVQQELQQKKISESWSLGSKFSSVTVDREKYPDKWGWAFYPTKDDSITTDTITTGTAHQ
jgi:hypothetical protein